ncbi:MAG: alpha/beta hydrolase [Azoarcus sp.]|nr:alpha/beta hydrolase [Azoarcus sp.]
MTGRKRTAEAGMASLPCREGGTRRAFIAVIVLVIVLCGLLGLASGCSRYSMFYAPSHAPGPHTPRDFGWPFQDVRFASADGTLLHGWFIPAMPRTRGVVLYVAGKSGSIGHNLAHVNWLLRKHYAVFMFDYRGYGTSGDGTLEPRSLVEDTRAALAYLKDTRPEIRGDTPRLLILAQGVGGNNALAALAAEGMEGVAGIVLDSTFHSYRALSAEKYPSTDMGVADDYSANLFIGRLAPVPLLLLHGDRDETIPPTHSQRLFEAAGEPKELVIAPGAGHLEALRRPGMRTRVVEFFDACVAGTLQP